LAPHLLIRVRVVHCHCILPFQIRTPTDVSSEHGSASFPIAPLRPTSPDLLTFNGISLRSTASALLATLAPSRIAGGLATRGSHGETISSSTYATFIISTYQSDGQANEAPTGQVSSHSKSPSLSSHPFVHSNTHPETARTDTITESPNVREGAGYGEAMDSSTARNQPSQLFNLCFLHRFLGLDSLPHWDMGMGFEKESVGDGTGNGWPTHISHSAIVGVSLAARHPFSTQHAGAVRLGSIMDLIS
jgi:hypothetical protein